MLVLPKRLVESESRNSGTVAAIIIMSNSVMCPECKKRPVPANRYLCAKCEAEIVKTAEVQPGRKPKATTPKRRASTRVRPQVKVVVADAPQSRPFWKFWARPKDPDAEITAEMDRKFERPRTLQYTLMAVLIVVGCFCVWGAKSLADDKIKSQVGTIHNIHEAFTGFSRSWHKLDDELTN